MRQGQYRSPSSGKGHGTTVTVGGNWTQVSRLGMPVVNALILAGLVGVGVARRRSRCAA